jgi:hypothetical protein
VGVIIIENPPRGLESGWPQDGRRVVDAFARVTGVLAENEQGLRLLDAHENGVRAAMTLDGARGALASARTVAAAGRSSADTLRGAADGWRSDGGALGELWGAIWCAIADIADAQAASGEQMVTEALAAVREVLAHAADDADAQGMRAAAIGLDDGWRAAAETPGLSARWHCAVRASTDAALATSSPSGQKDGDPDAIAVSLALMAGALEEE